MYIYIIGALQAEFLLVRSEHEGSFLVRESQSKPGDYTLSLYV